MNRRAFCVAAARVYLINSPMLPDLKLGPDGGPTIYIQGDSPGEDKEANRLPAPKGPFMLIMRLDVSACDAREVGDIH